jgi:hypothetical protein
MFVPEDEWNDLFVLLAGRFVLLKPKKNDSEGSFTFVWLFHSDEEESAKRGYRYTTVFGALHGHGSRWKSLRRWQINAGKNDGTIEKVKKWHKKYRYLQLEDAWERATATAPAVVTAVAASLEESETRSEENKMACEQE